MMHMFGFMSLLFPFVFIVAGIGLVAGARRVLTARSARTPQEHYRAEPDSNRLEPTIYRLAKRMGGRITVTDVVIEAGISGREAERVLQEMTDGLRVRMDVDDRGLVTYEFSELISDR